MKNYLIELDGIKIDAVQAENIEDVMELAIHLMESAGFQGMMVVTEER